MNPDEPNFYLSNAVDSWNALPDDTTPVESVLTDSLLSIATSLNVIAESLALIARRTPPKQPI